MSTTVRQMTRDQRRSLALGHAVATALTRDPAGVLAIAQRNLSQMLAAHRDGQVNPWLSEWGRLLDGPVPAIVDALTSPEPHARELRQNSPFAGVLDQHQRMAVLASFRAEEAANLSPA